LKRFIGKTYYSLMLLMCVILIPSCVPFPGYYTRGQIAVINRKKLSLISEGMTKEEVIDKMGKKYLCEDFEGAHCMYNPVGKEEMQLSNGESIEVLYYFTQDLNLGEWQWEYQNKDKDKECSPLVFKNNKLIGWGNTFLEKTQNISK